MKFFHWLLINKFLMVIFIISNVLSQEWSFMRSLRSLFVVGRNEVDNSGISYPKVRDGIRRQRSIPQNVPFPCDTRLGRSPIPPNSVHRLRPGDIDVVAGLGDSLVAASGALEEFAIGTFIEARGVSWCAGGQGDWRQFFTLPNLLKEFNKNLTGYATGTGEFISSKAGLNVAFPVAATEDALHQAKILVRRMKNNKNIDIKNHWKLVTILFGANDICSGQCYNSQLFSPSKYVLYLRKALDYLKFNLPKTLVNLVPTIDVTVSVRVPRSTMCNILHPLYCACLHQGQNPEMEASKASRSYQNAIKSLISSGRYDDSSDFTVVLQPFITIFNAPNADPLSAPPLDPNMVTYDCFHFSQKGHALAANLLWNNMLEPVGNKSSDGIPRRIMEKILCPTEKAPFFFTNVNSKFFYDTGNQYGIIS
ncbi:phospholipase B1, membrane-associated-like [Chelonus insularis]|uniref:phospholipase B1, membrane-associated-like n=1 Tax=Chelonus insularis TaxID=460826 RepID=UPI00158B78A8|nr:phospholipase B1, membrane-associated-like [Chelonus insularis]